MHRVVYICCIAGNQWTIGFAKPYTSAIKRYTISYPLLLVEVGLAQLLSSYPITRLFLVVEGWKAVSIARFAQGSTGPPALSSSQNNRGFSVP